MTQQKWIVTRTAEELAEALNLTPADAQAWNFGARSRTVSPRKSPGGNSRMHT
jgi:hypothetical protein